MGIRRALAATSVLLGLLGHGPAGAIETYRMDGKRSTAYSYRATLDQPTVPVNTVRQPSFVPLLSDCAPGSCDVRELRLALPKGTTWGQFTASVEVPRTLAGAVVLYDAKDKPLADDDLLFLGGLTSCCNPASYTLHIALDRLRAGRYKIAIVNRGGAAEVKATVRWVAHPPDRKR